MKFITGIATDIGKTRASNQDAICMIEAKKLNKTIMMMNVCDGMGGLSKGEVASATVIKGVEAWFEKELLDVVELCSMEEIRRLWIEKLTELRNQLNEYGKREGILLGTTFSGILCCGKNYIWVHIGDSRIYKITLENVVQITTDHTIAAREAAIGNLTKDQAGCSPLRNKLTQCVGPSKTFIPESGVGTIGKNESILICSDGFYHTFSKNEMLALNQPQYQSEKSLNRFCQNAIGKVIARGEQDNVSVAVLKCERGDAIY